MSPYLAKHHQKRVHGPAWPDPLIPTAPRVLALAVVEHALNVDLLDPRRILPVSTWLLESGVLPTSGPVARRRIVPKVLRAVEKVLAGEPLTNYGARRYKRGLPPDHRPGLVELLRRHRST